MTEFNTSTPEPATAARPVPIALLVLALPIIASMVSRTAMSWIDFAMVSQLGSEAQAAIVPASIGLFCLISLGFGVSSAVSTLVSQHLGRGEERRCGAYAWQGVWFGVVWGVVMLPLWPVVPGLIQSFGHEPSVVDMEVAYLSIGLLGIGPAVVGAALTNFFTGIHRPWAGFWAILAANAFNIVGNYALIYGSWGFPRMGVAGAAWATTIASFLTPLVLLGFMLTPTLRHRFASFADVRPQWPLLRKLLRIGLPAGFQFSGDIITFTLFLFLLVGRFGTEAMAGSNIAMKFFELAIMPCIGVGLAAGAAVGKSIGEQNLTLAKRQAYWSWAINMTYAAIVAVIYLTLGRTLVSLLSDDSNVVAVADAVLVCLAVFQIFDCTQFTFANVLRAAGDTLVPAIIMFGSTIGIMLTGGYLIAVNRPEWGVLGPWWAAASAFGVLALAYFTRFAVGRWQKIDLHGGGAAKSEIQIPNDEI